MNILLERIFQNVESLFVFVSGVFNFVILDEHLDACYDPRKLKKGGMPAVKFLEELFRK